MKKMILGCLIGLFSMNLFANEINQPEGAFGLKLGEDFKNLKVVKNIELTNGSILYQVIPPNPMGDKFQTYMVSITPKTKKVNFIRADKDYEGYGNRDECRKDKDEMLLLLENKYGKFQLLPGLNINENKSKEINDTTILANCNMMGETFSLYYISDKYNKISDKEKNDLIIEKTNSDML